MRPAAVFAKAVSKISYPSHILSRRSNMDVRIDWSKKERKKERRKAKSKRERKEEGKRKKGKNEGQKEQRKEKSKQKTYVNYSQVYDILLLSKSSVAIPIKTNQLPPPWSTFCLLN